MASKTLLGMVCAIKPCSDSALDSTPEVAFAAGNGKCIAFPGSKIPTKIKPRVSEITDAKINQPSALPPTRPTVAISPILAMPTTNVEKTKGAMIILIKRKKMVGNRPVSSEKPGLAS